MKIRPPAVLDVARQYIDIFSNSHNPFLQEKTQDVQDLTIRLMNNLLHNEEPMEARIAGGW